MTGKEERALRRKVENFLKELDLLTEKYGMQIGGCESCCDAPWVVIPGRNPVYVVKHLRYCKSCEGYGPAAAHEDC